MAVGVELSLRSQEGSLDPPSRNHPQHPRNWYPALQAYRLNAVPTANPNAAASEPAPERNEPLNPTPSGPPKRSLARTVAAACIVAAGFAFLGMMLKLNLDRTNPAGRDFIEYWATEQQLVHGANPYDEKGVLATQQAVGYDRQWPEFWYSPPPNLALALPLGFVSAKNGLVLWILFHFALLSASIWVLWRIHGRPDTLLYLLGFLFPPALLCLMAGQISILFLFGVTLFLYLHKTHPFLAGVALVPCALKPHLFLPFGVALLLWVVTRRAYRILAGSFVAIGSSTALIYCIDRDAWAQYATMMKNEGMLQQHIATLSSTLRFWVAPGAVWLQFVPCGLACCWAAWYFWTRRARWSWMEQGLLLMLVSAVAAPYGWFFDESVLLPAVLTGFFRARERGRSVVPLALAIAVGLFEVHQGVNVLSKAYLWSTPVWLAWYLYATWKPRTTAEEARHAN